MAKKTRKVLKQASQQRAIQQAQANLNTAGEPAAASAATTVTVPTPVARVQKVGISDEQEFTYVKSDVRRSLTLAGIFIAAMVVLSFVLR